MILSYWFWLGAKVNITDILILKKEKGKGNLKGFGNLSEQAESLCAILSTHKPGITCGIACIPALGRQRKENQKFKVILVYIAN